MVVNPTNSSESEELKDLYHAPNCGKFFTASKYLKDLCSFFCIKNSGSCNESGQEIVFFALHQEHGHAEISTRPIPRKNVWKIVWKPHITFC